MDDLNLKIFLPFEKRDDDQRVVGGYATTEAIDSQGEVVKADAIEKALPDYMKFANVREMHQWSAVGKTISANMDSDKKGLNIVAKVVDDTAWKKVKEGVYNGFSIGGRVLKRVGNVIQELILNEISLVDRPANPEAVFSLVKMRDGKIVEKNGVAMESTPPEPPHLGLRLATKLTEWAEETSWMISMCEDMERPAGHLTPVLEALKTAAKKELELDKVAKADEQKDEKASTLDQLKEVKAKLEQIVANKGLLDTKSYNDKYYTQSEVVQE